MSDLRRILIDQIIDLVRPQWRRIPIEDIPENPVEAFVMGRNQMVDQIRTILGPEASEPKEEINNPNDYH